MRAGVSPSVTVLTAGDSSPYSPPANKGSRVVVAPAMLGAGWSPTPHGAAHSSYPQPCLRHGWGPLNAGPKKAGGARKKRYLVRQSLGAYTCEIGTGMTCFSGW